MIDLTHFERHKGTGVLGAVDRRTVDLLNKGPLTGSINIVCAAGDFLQPSRGFQPKRSDFSLKFVIFARVSASAIP